jgi:hypothetical protein
MGKEPNQQGNSRRWLTRAVKDSLRRLQTDYIALYVVHRPAPDTDIEETLSALTDLMRVGKVRARIVDLPGLADRGGAMGRSTAGFLVFAPNSRLTRSSTAALSVRCCPPVRKSELMTY